MEVNRLSKVKKSIPDMPPIMVDISLLFAILRLFSISGWVHSMDAIAACILRHPTADFAEQNGRNAKLIGHRPLPL